MSMRKAGDLCTRTALSKSARAIFGSAQSYSTESVGGVECKVRQWICLIY